MNFPLPVKQKKNISFRKALIGIFLLLGAIFSMDFFFPQVWADVTIQIAKPFWRGREWLGGVIFENTFFESKNKIAEENTELRKENEDLRERMNEIDILRADNQAFRETFGIPSGPSAKAYAVLVHPSQTPYDILVLDAQQGTKPSLGTRVVSGLTALGTTVEAGESFIKIDLYSSNARETDGRLLPSGTPLLLVGKGGGNFSVRVPRDMGIGIGDLVVLPGDPAYALARVGSVEESEKDSFKYIRLISPKNIFTLRWVEILE